MYDRVNELGRVSLETIINELVHEKKIINKSHPLSNTLKGLSMCFPLEITYINYK